MIIISISGGSASGKTTFAKELHQNLKNSFLLSQDNYTKDVSHLSLKEIEEYDFDQPDSIHSEELINNIKELKLKGKTKIPEYDFISAKCKLKEIEIKKPQYLILEGIFSLHFKEIINLSNLKIFIHAEEETRYERRLKRDVKERGNTEKEIRNRFINFVKPSHDNYIEPQKNVCDFIIDSDEMKTHINKMIEEIKKIENQLINFSSLNLD
jgi:uridine kinase